MAFFLDVDGTLVAHLVAGGFVPVVSPLARDANDPAGGGLNVNGDDAAAALAGAIHADDLVLVADVPGVLDKDKKLIYLYATNILEQHAYIDAAKNRGYEVLLMDTMLDSHYINHLEQKLKDIQFVRVDSDTVEKLIKKDNNNVSKLSDEQKKKFFAAVKGIQSELAERAKVK